MITYSSLVTGRLTSQQCLAHCRTSLPLSLRRVAILCNLSTSTARQYATDRPVSRPKAHTGRTTTTRKPRAAATSTRAAATASTSKAKPKTRGRASVKPKAKPKAKSKAKTKAKRKAKPKPRVKKPRTEKQKATAAAKKSRSEISGLRDKLLKPPHPLPSTAFLVLFEERSKGKKGLVGGIAGISKQISAEYKALSTEQREHYNHVANENKAKNETQYRRWIESHTPTQVHESNRARALLQKRNVHVPPKLKDDREVKTLKTSYTHFYRERFRSGDFSSIPVTEAAKRIGQEWRQLSGAQKQPYVDLQAKDMVRYEQEIKSVYNRDVKYKKS